MVEAVNQVTREATTVSHCEQSIKGEVSKQPPIKSKKRIRPPGYISATEAAWRLNCLPSKVMPILRLKLNEVIIHGRGYWVPEKKVSEALSRLSPRPPDPPPVPPPPPPPPPPPLAPKLLRKIDGGCPDFLWSSPSERPLRMIFTTKGQGMSAFYYNATIRVTVCATLCVCDGAGNTIRQENACDLEDIFSSAFNLRHKINDSISKGELEILKVRNSQGQEKTLVVIKGLVVYLRRHSYSKTKLEVCQPTSGLVPEIKVSV